jgi:two-component system, NarL family, response regulator NreC
MKKYIKIGLVDDQLLVRSGFKTLIDGWGDMEVIFESSDGHSVIKRLTDTDRHPDVMLVDIGLPGKGDLVYSGMHLTMDMKRHFPKIKILIVSVQDDPVTIAYLIEKGAQGFLSKACRPEELETAIRAAHQNGSYINEKTLKALQGRLDKGGSSPLPKSDELTSREVEVLRLICQQFTAEEIGEKLFISAKTVNGHRNNLLLKTASRNITGLVMYAVKTGLVEIT